jgi:hypothetical protein
MDKLSAEYCRTICICVSHNIQLKTQYLRKHNIYGNTISHSIRLDSGRNVLGQILPCM